MKWKYFPRYWPFVPGIHRSPVNSPHKGQWRGALMFSLHYNDVIMRAMASQITSLTIVYSTVYSRRRLKKTSKLRVAGLCDGNSPVTGEFPAQMASNAENVSIWWVVMDLRPNKRLNKIVSLNYSIALQFDRHIGSTAAEMPVKFQSDRTILNTNLAAMRVCDILQ